MSSTLIIPSRVGPSSQVQSCGTCHFGRVDKDNDLNCHKNPPSVFIDPLPNGKFEVVSVFPLMKAHQWCGCWVSRDAPTSG